MNDPVLFTMSKYTKTTDDDYVFRYRKDKQMLVHHVLCRVNSNGSRTVMLDENLLMSLLEAKTFSDALKQRKYRVQNSYATDENIFRYNALYPENIGVLNTHPEYLNFVAKKTFLFDQSKKQLTREDVLLDE